MATRATYRFRKGFPTRGLDAEVVGAELERIKTETGGMDPADIITAAKPARSPLHKFFEWNNDQAADQFRIAQARALVGAVVIRVNVHGPKTDPVEVRAFVSVPSGEGDGRTVYVGIRDAMRNTERREYVLRKARAELEGWRDRWAVYDELATLVKSVGAALEATAASDRPGRKAA